MNKLNHVAIIMDGNGRWGLKKKNSRNYGHLKGLNTVELIIKTSVKKKYLFLHFSHFQQRIGNDQKKRLIFSLI